MALRDLSSLHSKVWGKRTGGFWLQDRKKPPFTLWRELAAKGLAALGLVKCPCRHIWMVLTCDTAMPRRPRQTQMSVGAGLGCGPGLTSRSWSNIQPLHFTEGSIAQNDEPSLNSHHSFHHMRRIEKFKGRLSHHRSSLMRAFEA